mgnify:CR=1 FL=1
MDKMKFILYFMVKLSIKIFFLKNNENAILF